MAAHAFELMTLLDAPGVGPARVRKLLKKWQTVPETPLLDNDLLREMLTESQVAALPASQERIKKHWGELENRGVNVVSVLDPNYPNALRHLLGDKAPLVLMCVGNLAIFEKVSVGFCGSRDASEKGLRVAWDSAALLAHHGINVVSGFATGVDRRSPDVSPPR